ncbi:hypothetical protein [Aliivibrio fischeri]|uniref:Uncharacterized protein n=1 Tax=Aliivibrio fischeri TaxID=668 RepID=A0A510UN29_ALIFS|nr:hypothetical protein [Aliivibrio fischeri]MUK51189.1 hypothetical protein [Aliivibrio fischeri]GEK16082.1 hypothetical protein AFI02nite_41180 [Aliivibrio fischeri]
MTKCSKKKIRIIAVIQTEKYDKYGFTSLETLSGWHGKIDKNKGLNVECKKVLM